MKNTITVQTDDNKILTVELLFNFKVDSIGKEYIVYTINDDGVSEKVSVLISEIIYEGDMPRIVPIEEDEKEMVLLFYDNIRRNC